MMAAQGGADPKMKEIMAVLMHGYPWHTADCGDLDLTGFRKPQSFYRDILWNGGDRVYATVKFPAPEGKAIVATAWATYPSLPSWSWPGQEGKNMEVEVYSGAEKARLYLNGKLIGEQPTGRSQASKATFSVPYAPGELKFEGIRGGKVVAQGVIRTNGPAAKLRLTADRRELQADGQDLAYVTVEAVDAKGQLVQNADQEVSFALSGPGVIAAVGNGNGQDTDSYQGTHRKLFYGRAEVIVRTTRKGGALKLRAEAPGLSDATAEITTKSPAKSADLQ
jgi:beta-galactosidase